MAGSHSIFGSRPAGRFPLSYRLRAAHGQFRYSAAGRAIRRVLDSGLGGFVAAAASVAAGALPLLVCRGAVGLIPGSLQGVALCVGVAGAMIVALDLVLAWLTDADWVKLDIWLRLAPLMLGLAVMLVCRLELSPVCALLPFVAQMWGLAVALDAFGQWRDLQRAQDPIFDPFSGRYLSNGE